MSNGEEVKRWQAWVIADEVQRFQPIPEFFVSDEDHDRIVAEKDAAYNKLDDINMALNEKIAIQKRVIEKLKERLTSWISETHPNDEHLRNMCLMVEERELAAIEKGEA